MSAKNYQLMDLPNEVWMDITDYEGIYQISNHGRLKSLKRNLKNQHGKHDLIIKQRTNRDGYLRVNLKNNNKIKVVNIHRLVAIYFVPNPTALTVVNHIDGNKENNKVDNLVWCTEQENTIHAYRSNLAKAKSGAESQNAKLTEDDVKSVYIEYFEKGISPGIIAKKYNVSRRCIEKIVNGETWKKLAGECGVVNV